MGLDTDHLVRWMPSSTQERIACGGSLESKNNIYGEKKKCRGNYDEQGMALIGGPSLTR